MEITNTFIEELAVNENAIINLIALSLHLENTQVSAVIELFADGNTVPFIARYRKEKTGSLDEMQIREIDHLFNSTKKLEERRIEIARMIFKQEALTESLFNNINGASTLAELEDIYTPYKHKKKTRAMLASQRGLEPLASSMQEVCDDELNNQALNYISIIPEQPELSVHTASEALQGAMDIIAERVAHDPSNRALIKSFFIANGSIIVKGIGSEEDKKTSVYQMYWDYTEQLSSIKPHRIMAINRGEREEALETKLEIDQEGALAILQKKYTIHNTYHKKAIEEGLRRLLLPAITREIRADQEKLADEHSISIFSTNLKNLLLQQPIKGTRVLGIDPGIRTGSKCACLDDTGKYLGSFVIYNHKTKEAGYELLKAIRSYDVQLIAVGNGTGSQDVQNIVTNVITDNALNVFYTVVDEEGASVYSASDIAREEFPNLDVTIRGAISIGRRLQDPLAELVKIDPKSIGVGLYQHDVNQEALSESLDEVVVSVVNNVGVNVNTASASLLRYVSGINRTLAHNIVKYRDEQGKIQNRVELMNIHGMGLKSFEQGAGFLKVPESSEPLDNTWVHPEHYDVARKLHETITKTGVVGNTTFLKENYGVGDATINDIIDELKRPGRDLRDDYPKPILQKGALTFEDLHEGMRLTGKIKNVVDFGAFVDLGIKETALVHISEISDHFVKDPFEIVKVGDVMEFSIVAIDNDRRRVSLSLKSKEQKQAIKAPPKPEENKAQSNTKALHNSTRQADHKAYKRPPKDDDGTMYNPFAQLLKDRSRRRP